MTALNKDAQDSQDRTFPSCLSLFVSLSSGAEEAGGVSVPGKRNDRKGNREWLTKVGPETSS